MYDLSKDNSEEIDISSAHPEVFEGLRKAYDTFWNEAWEYAKDREFAVVEEMEKWDAEPWLPPFWERYATQYNYTQEQRDELMKKVKSKVKRNREMGKL